MRVLGFLILIVVLHNGSTLRCFQCLGSLTGDCFNAVIPSMIAIECDDAAVAISNVTNLPKHIRGVKDVVIETKCVAMVTNLLGMTFMERGCGWIYEGVDICQFMTNDQGLDLSNCSSCNTELCNTGVFIK